MLNEEKIKDFANVWATDMPIKALNGSILINEDVINQSIEMILATPKGSRLFNLYFGSDFSLKLFDNMSKRVLNDLVEDTIKQITLFEDRITIIKSLVELNVDYNENTIILTIPYIINERNISGVFSKTIRE